MNERAKPASAAPNRLDSATSEPCRLGEFEIATLLGRGGAGSVWAGRHLATGAEVAIKLLNASAAVDAVRGRFVRELESVAGLHHPHIIYLFDFGELDARSPAVKRGLAPAGAPYLVMELASGGSLAAEGRPTTWEATRAVLVTVLGALAHAHGRGLVHGDIKPANIVLCGPTDLRPGPKLADFGIAQLAAHRADAAPSDQVQGTPRYMAPEQILRAVRDVGPWTDLYAVGCLAYELVTGQPPFMAADLLELAQAHLSQLPPPLVPRFGVPADFPTWLDGLLGKTPASRFGTAADALAALQGLSGDALAATQPLPDMPGPLPEASTWFTSDTPRDPWESTDTAPHTQPFEVESAPAAGPPGDEGPPVPRDWRGLAAPAGDSTYPSLTRYRLRGAGMRLFGLRDVPLVGLQTHRDRLWDVLRTVAERGRPQAVWLRGPQGAGKTALARWFSRLSVEVAGARLFTIASADKSVTTAALAQVVRQATQSYGLEGEQALRRVEAVLRRVGVSSGYEWHALHGVLSEKPTRLGDRLAAVRRLLRTLCRARPVVVWLDGDPVDDEAAALVQSMCNNAEDGDGAVLFVMSAREIPVGSKLDGTVEPLDVPALGVADLARLVDSLLELEPSLSARIAEETDGHPGLAVRWVRELVTTGALTWTSDGYRLTQGRLTRIVGASEDAAVREQVERFAAELGPEVSESLELAAAEGSAAGSPAWRRACQALELPCRSVDLDRAARLGVIRRAAEPTGAWLGEDGFVFASGVVRRGFAERANRDRRAWGHHAALAEAWAAIAPSAHTPGAGAWGRHLVECGRGDEAVPILIEAGTQALFRGQFSRGFAMARLAERGASAERVDLRARAVWLRSRLSHNRGLRAEAERQAREALDLANQSGDPAVLAPVLVHVATMARVGGHVETARELYESALEAAEQVHDVSSASAAVQFLGDSYRGVGEVDAAETHFERAYDVAYAHDLPEREVGALRGLCWVARNRGQFDLARSLAERALEAAKRWGSELGVSACLNELGEVARYAGNVEEAEGHYREALELMVRLDGMEQWPIRLNLALILLGRERMGDLRALLEPSMALLRRAGRRGLLAAAHVLLLPALAHSRDWERFDHHAERAHELLIETKMVDRDLAKAAARARELSAEAGRVDAEARAAAIHRTQLKS